MRYPEAMKRTRVIFRSLLREWIIAKYTWKYMSEYERNERAARWEYFAFISELKYFPLSQHQFLLIVCAKWSEITKQSDRDRRKGVLCCRIFNILDCHDTTKIYHSEIEAAWKWCHLTLLILKGESSACEFRGDDNGNKRNYEHIKRWYILHFNELLHKYFPC